MTDLFQGSALPSTVTTTQNQTTAPQFYTDYLQNIANLGQNAVTQGGVAGFSPLQQQAFQMAPQTAFAGSDTLGQAANLINQSGTTTAPSVVNAYMNPYTNNVVNEMARLSQQNVQRSILPALAAAGVSTGGFGSTRQATATGQSLADVQSNLTGQQYGALNTGYKDAITAAQADLTRQLNAGQDLTNTGKTQNDVANAGINQLNALGLEQQKQGQALLDYPMLQAQNYGRLLSGYTIPTGSTTQVTAPGTQGQFSNSPLSQIAGLGTLFASLFGNNNSTSGGTTGGSNTGGGSIPQSTVTNIISQIGQEAWDGIKSIFGYADGGTVGYADGGGVQGGLQSLVQGVQNNTNVPQTVNVGNTNVPNIGLNPPLMQPQNLNMYDSVGGSVNSPNFQPEQG